MTFEDVLGPIPKVKDLISQNKLRYHNVLKDIRAGKLRASMFRGAWRCKPEDWEAYVENMWNEGLNVKPGQQKTC
jgi:hypothetical protein